MAMSMFQLGMLEGIARPAIAALWPTRRGQSVVLDVGANVSADAEQLVDFAVMGEAFARAMLGLERPTVGILNVGAEDVKGNEAVQGRGADPAQRQSADRILRLRRRRRYRRRHGRRRGHRRLHRQYRAEDRGRHGQAGRAFLRRALERSLLSAGSARCIASGALNTLRRKLDPRAANGGIFLGLNGVVVKSHGGTDAIGFASAIDMAIDMAKADIDPAHRRRPRAASPLKPGAGRRHS